MERYRAPVRREDRVRVGLALELVAASTGVPKEKMEERKISRSLDSGLSTAIRKSAYDSTQ